MSTIKRWYEYEDWLEFYTQRDLLCIGTGQHEVMMNFGGPGSATPYHFYARLKTGGEKVITDVSIENESFHFAPKIIAVNGTPPCFNWVHLGWVKMSRNYRRVILTIKDLSALDGVCVAEVPERIESGEIERHLGRRGRPAEPLSGVPLGGIGAGKLEFCRDGLFRNITINGNIDTPIRHSEASFFALRAEVAGGRTLGRIVSTEGRYGLPPMEKIEFEGLFPSACLRGTDGGMPFSVEIHAGGSIIPHNLKDSALPLALFRVRLIARPDQASRATVAFCMENFLGQGGSIVDHGEWDKGYYQYWQEPAGNLERPWRSADGEGLLFDCGPKEEQRSQGQYILASRSAVHSRLMGWRLNEQPEVWSKFIATGRLPDKVEEPSRGGPTAGAIAVATELHPGETQDLFFVWAWYVPHFWQAPGHDYSHFYCRDFSSAAEVAGYGLRCFERLENETAEAPRLLLKSSLPAWFGRSLCNDAYIASTATWLTRDGRFSVNESPTHMFGCMGTLDQKLYANHYYTLFFPELDRTELLAFARSQGSDGSIQHDLGYGHLEQTGQGCHWPDLSSALVLLAFKHYQLTGDQAFIDELYPHLVRALLEYQLGRDTDDDGIANISGVGNTFDAEKFEGTSSYIASLWLAALKALETLAKQRNDAQTAQSCAKVFVKARENAIRELWNGDFFVNYYDAVKQQRCANSHFSQLAGEFFARFCGLGPLYGDHYVRQALLSMLRLNYPPELRFPTNEATPDGKMSCRKLWGWLPHARVFLGATPFFFGLAAEGWRVLERLENVLVAVNNDNRWDQRLFFEPDTGRQHWGRFYMTAPATWYVYQALLGYQWDQSRGLFSLEPHLPPGLRPYQGPVFLPAFWAWIKIDADCSCFELEIIKQFDQQIHIRQVGIPRQGGTLVATADGMLLPIQPVNRTNHAAESTLEYYSCQIDLGKIRKIRLAFLPAKD